jgi:predicted DCC family thiol-disulfide oxidoreductase YuxK
MLPARQPLPGARHVVFYDGVCGLCDRSVQFLLARDRERVLHFAPLQGSTAAAVLGRLGLGAVIVPPATAAADAAPAAGREGPGAAEPGTDPGAPATMVFVRDEGSERERVFVRSAGALAALEAIGGGWRLASWLRIVPAPLRDLVYRWVAANRYRWFGRFDTCKLPAPGVRDRFLD